jgi:hypothetical protein
MRRPGRRRGLSWYERIFNRKRPKPPRQSKPSTPKPNRVIKTTLSKYDPTMLKQLQQVRKYSRIIKDVSRRYSYLQPSIICGIGSRESHWGLALKPVGPGGRGDFARRRPRGERRTPEPPDGGGYGRGLMQIDYDWHEFARTGRWQDPRENLMYACVVIDNARKFFKREGLRLNDDQLLHAVIAAYNGGATATMRAIKAGKDIDANTTGRDYGRDVLNRTAWFQLHGWK